MLLTTRIIIYVLNPVIVFDKLLLNFLFYLFIYLFINCCDILIYITLHIYINITVDIFYVYNPCLFHSLDLIIKSS